MSCATLLRHNVHIWYLESDRNKMLRYCQVSVVSIRAHLDSLLPLNCELCSLICFAKHFATNLHEPDRAWSRCIHICAMQCLLGQAARDHDS